MGIPKCATGVRGFDDITEGGLPRACATLVCGDAGSGKTLLAMEFIARGAARFHEPGLFVSFEESPAQLRRNAPSGLGLDALIRKRKIHIESLPIEHSAVREAGAFDLEPLFLRLGRRIDAMGAKRVVLDGVETLFAALASADVVRAELGRLLRWLKAKGVTAVVTAERGDSRLTRHGVEEYVSDCVVVLEQSRSQQISTRYLYILKYRGSRHGTNHYPFLIDESGVIVVPITTSAMRYRVSRERISTGIADLDLMLGGGGVYRGTTVMISGAAGTGKTSVAASASNAACARGERVLYAAFEESEDQIVRNMGSIGLDLRRWVGKGLLRFHCERPHSFGLEGHLAQLYAVIERYAPRVVIIDPVSGFDSIGSPNEVKAMLTRLIDHLKAMNITAVLTTLLSTSASAGQTEVGVSSVIDTWFLLRNIEAGAERTRALMVLKSRGMAHSNQVREFLLTRRGVRLVDVYVGPEGVLTGSSRAAQEARDHDAAEALKDEVQQMRRALERKQHALQARHESGLSRSGR